MWWLYDKIWSFEQTFLYFYTGLCQRFSPWTCAEWADSVYNICFSDHLSKKHLNKYNIQCVTVHKHTTRKREREREILCFFQSVGITDAQVVSVVPQRDREVKRLRTKTETSFVQFITALTPTHTHTRTHTHTHTQTNTPASIRNRRTKF